MVSFKIFAEEYNFDDTVVEYGFVDTTGGIIRDTEEDGNHSDIVKRLKGDSVENLIRRGYIRYLIEEDHKLCLSFIDTSKTTENAMKFVKNHPKAIGSIDYDIYHASNRDMEIPDDIGTAENARDFMRKMRSR